MLFQVIRTSIWDDKVQPCPEAERTSRWKTEDSLISRWNWVSDDNVPCKRFYEVGRNHRVEGEHCYREVETVYWVVEYDILDFIKKYGQCVVSYVKSEDPVGGGPDYWLVEIYDDWRE